MFEKIDTLDLLERVFNANPADHLPMVQIFGPQDFTTGAFSGNDDQSTPEGYSSGGMFTCRRLRSNYRPKNESRARSCRAECEGGLQYND
jgi:hypothetical protein